LADIEGDNWRDFAGTASGLLLDLFLEFLPDLVDDLEAVRVLAISSFRVTARRAEGPLNGDSGSFGTAAICHFGEERCVSFEERHVHAVADYFGYIFVF